MTTGAGEGDGVIKAGVLVPAGAGAGLGVPPHEVDE